MSKTIKETVTDTVTAQQDKLLSRRAVLRGALMVGCGLLASTSLFSTPASAATKKLEKPGVKYQDKPKGDQKCGTCTNYIAASKTCKLVDGSINPSGWCMLWARKG